MYIIVHKLIVLKSSIGNRGDMKLFKYLKCINKCAQIQSLWGEVSIRISTNKKKYASRATVGRSGHIGTEKRPLSIGERLMCVRDTCVHSVHSVHAYVLSYLYMCPMCPMCPYI